MDAIYGDLDRRIFTGVAIHDIAGVVCNHRELATHINNRPIEAVISLPYARHEGIPLLSTPSIHRGEKHFYTCILIQGTTHTLFAYESFDYADHNNNNHRFSRFLPPHDTDVVTFLNDDIIY